VDTVAAPRTPGPWRTADGSAVELNDAKAAWALSARDVLIKTAKHYNAHVTYKELAEQVQELSGIRTRSPMRHWIGSVLDLAVDDSHRRGEPALAALCVRQDETVGEGYAYVLSVAGLDTPKDLEKHAANARLECHRFFGASMPPGGGRPTLTPRVAAARARAAKAVERPIFLCPGCFTQLPSSGQCDNCV
jgi:hypothetical protein